MVHSVIIGISLGASGNPKTIKPLVAALSFHQFFEGLGLGGCISEVPNFTACNSSERVIPFFFFKRKRKTKKPVSATQIF